MTDKLVLLQIRIPEKKRRRFKAIASMEGKTMTSVVEDYINEYIEEREDKLLMQSDSAIS